jgi:hypothetical protein
VFTTGRRCRQSPHLSMLHNQCILTVAVPPFAFTMGRVFRVNSSLWLSRECGFTCRSVGAESSQQYQIKMKFLHWSCCWHSLLWMLRVQTIGIPIASRGVCPVANHSQAPTARVILGSAKRIELIINESFRLINYSTNNHTLRQGTVCVTHSEWHFRVFVYSFFLVVRAGASLVWY